MGYFYSNIWSPCQTMTQTIFVQIKSCWQIEETLFCQSWSSCSQLEIWLEPLIISWLAISQKSKLNCTFFAIVVCRRRKKEMCKFFYKKNVSSFEIVHSQPLFVYFVLFEQYLLKKEWRLQQGLTLWRPSYWSPPSPPPLPLPPPPPPLPPWPLKQTSHYATFVAKYMHSLTS